MKHSFTEQGLRKLPEPIVARLKAVITRVRRMQALKGAFATLAVAIISALVVMGIDAAFAVESKGLRLTLSLTALTITGLTLWRWLLRPISRHITLTSVARWVETHHPEMQERISTAVELMGHPSRDAGSSELLAEVVKDAINDAGTLNPKSELSTKVTRRPFFTALTAAAVLIVLMIAWPKIMPRLLARLFSPLGDTGNAYADNIRLLTKSQIIAEKDPLNIEVAVQGKPERVELRMTMPDGKEVIESLQADTAVKTEQGETGYALRLPIAEKGFTARVAAGKAITEPFTITVLPRPVAEHLTLTFNYPAYTGRAQEVRRDVPGDIVALAGTKVHVRGQLNRPVTTAEVIMAGNSVDGVKLVMEGAQQFVEWTADLNPNLESTWRFSLEDEHHLTSHPVDYPIQATKDLPPVITLDSPQEPEFELRPTEKLPLAYTVQEDLGIAWLKIKANIPGRQTTEIDVTPLPVRETEPGDLWRGQTMLDLGKLQLNNVNELRFHMEVADSLPADLKGPQRARTREILIRIRRDATPLMQQTFAAQAEELRQEIEKAKQLVQEAKRNIENKPPQLAQQDQIQPESLREIEKAREKAEEAAKALNDISEKMKETAYARQAEDLKQVAQNLVDPAADKAENIPLTDDKKKRSEMAQQAAQQLDQALKQLDQERNQLKQEQQNAENVAQLEALAQEQARLAEEAQQKAQTTATQAAQEARSLAEKAKTLAEKQKAVAEQAKQADTPQKQQELASAQQQLDQDAQKFQEEARQFEQQNAAELNQNAAQQQALDQAQQDVEQARLDAGQAKAEAEQAAQNNQKPPAPPQPHQQQQAQQAMQQAQDLAKKAADLANKQAELAKQAAEADTAEKQQQLAQASQQAAQEAQQLTQQVEQFRSQNAGEIDKDTANLQLTRQAREDAKAAARDAQEAQQQAQQGQQESQQQAQQAQQNPEMKNQPNAGADEAKAAAQEARSAQQELAQAAENLSQLAENLKDDAAQPPQPNPAPEMQGKDEAQASAQDAQAAGQELAQAAEKLDHLADQLAQEAGQNPDAPLAQQTPQQQQQAQQAAQQAQQQWQQQQQQVAQEAQKLNSQMARFNNEAQQKAMQKTSAEAASLAQEAQKLAEQQAALSDQVAKAATPGTQKELAQQENQIAQKAEQLQQQAKQLNERAAGQIDQSSAAQEASAQAAEQLAEASAEAQQAGQELAQQAGQPAPEAANAEQPGKTQAQAAESSLTEAASALQQLSGALSGQSKSLAAESKAMQTGAKESKEAFQEGSQQGPNNAQPSSGNAQQSAQDAAQALAQAAMAAAQNMGIPQSARQNAQSKPGQGQGKGQIANKPGGQGKDPKAGAQPLGASQALPPELEKLGLTAAEWVKLRGILQGASSAESDRVPAEYRPLVKAYFSALTKGEPTGEEGKK